MRTEADLGLPMQLAKRQKGICRRIMRQTGTVGGSEDEAAGLWPLVVGDCGMDFCFCACVVWEKGPRIIDLRWTKFDATCSTQSLGLFDCSYFFCFINLLLFVICFFN